MSPSSTIRFIEKELKLIVKLEHDELRQFNKLVRETLADVEKTKKELKIEERIKLNLNFIQYKLNQIHKHIIEIIDLSKLLEENQKGKKNLELNHRVKSILSEIIELDREYIPKIKENLSMLSSKEEKKYKYIQEINKEFRGYKNLVDKLKLMFNLTEVSLRDLHKMRKVKLDDYSASLQISNNKPKKKAKKKNKSTKSKNSKKPK